MNGHTAIRARKYGRDVLYLAYSTPGAAEKILPVTWSSEQPEVIQVFIGHMTKQDNSINCSFNQMQTVP